MRRNLTRLLVLAPLVASAGCWCPGGEPPAEVDPLAVTLPQITTGTISPDDLTDTITFTLPVGTLAAGISCPDGPISVQLTGVYNGAPYVTTAPCDNNSGFISIDLDDNAPASIVVSAPGGPAGELRYSVDLS
jgi:hypothetical protein